VDGNIPRYPGHTETNIALLEQRWRGNIPGYQSYIDVTKTVLPEQGWGGDIPRYPRHSKTNSVFFFSEGGVGISLNVLVDQWWVGIYLDIQAILRQIEYFLCRGEVEISLDIQITLKQILYFVSREMAGKSSLDMMILLIKILRLLSRSGMGISLDIQVIPG
jgi:hypothetical protein